jgi:2-polyprenyl-3-methyl-5-hydroxy-6-metoxy-1,4-benzoquinol methylase
LQENYLEAIADYYNNSRLPSTPGAAASFRNDLARADYWGKYLVAEMQSVVEGRRVLEVACGMGKWTQLVADVAEQVTATDISANLLDNARGLPLPRSNVSFVQCSAFDVQQVEGDFNAGLHMNFINHLPLAQVAQFLDCFHTALGPGAVVFCGTQRFRGDAQNPMYELRDTGDMVSLRHHDDGRMIEIVDTLFTEDLLRGLLAGKATHMNFTMNNYWWWLTYRVA